MAVTASGSIRDGIDEGPFVGRPVYAGMIAIEGFRPMLPLPYTGPRDRPVAHHSRGGSMLLHSRLSKRWWPLALVPALLLLVGFRQAPLVDPPPIQVPANVGAAKVEQIVGSALTMRGWRIVKHVPGEVDAVYDPRNFSVTIAVHYDAQQIRINYVTSTNLRYEEKHGVRYIHKNYLSWIKNLVTDISNGLMMGK
jgi:hypothetical protein